MECTIKNMLFNLFDLILESTFQMFPYFKQGNGKFDRQGNIVPVFSRKVMLIIIIIYIFMIIPYQNACIIECLRIINTLIIMANCLYIFEISFSILCMGHRTPVFSHRGLSHTVLARTVTHFIFKP